jgi:hypothetical protein
LQTLCQTDKRPGHHRRSVVDEADRRGRPLADPEPTANPGFQNGSMTEPEAVPLIESPHRRGGWRPPRRSRQRIAQQDGQ